MTTLAEIVERMLNAGVDKTIIVDTIRLVEARNAFVTPRDGKAMTAAERAKKYRENRKAQSVTAERSRVTEVTASVTVDVPAPAPPSSPLVPPLEVSPAPLPKTPPIIPPAILPTPGRDVLDEAVEAWNTFAERHSLSKVSRLTEDRRKKLRLRLGECGGIDGWHTALDLIERSPGLMGKAGGTWKANFDWMLQQRSFTKLMEGVYGDWTAKESEFTAVFRERRARREAGSRDRPDREGGQLPFGRFDDVDPGF